MLGENELLVHISVTGRRVNSGESATSFEVGGSPAGVPRAA
jgi:hypothetical protein